MRGSGGLLGSTSSCRPSSRIARHTSKSCMSTLSLSLPRPSGCGIGTIAALSSCATRAESTSLMWIDLKLNGAQLRMGSYVCEAMRV
eukprot:1848364-Rhodomonas_salina.2